MNTTDSASTGSRSEVERQLAVDSLGLTRGQIHPRLDRICRLAQKFFDVTASGVTVLDHGRAFYPGSAGLDVAELPRDQTFCERTTTTGEVTVVEDTALDASFAAMSAVTDLGIRFYAGAPLLDGEGRVVATFCLFDDKPRRLDADEMATFLDMANWAQQELVDSTEMAQAGRVQASMLPDVAMNRDGWEVDGICIPALSVGGDFFDYSTANGVVHIAIGDVMGKGTGAALLGAGIRSALRGTLSAVSAGVDLGVTVTQIGVSQLPDLERAGSFVTLFQAAINTDDGRLRFVDAGSGLALLIRSDRTVEHLRGEDRPLGVLPEDFWTEHDRVMEPGERLVVFSDGLLDLIDDPDDWLAELGRLSVERSSVRDLLDAVVGLTRTGTPLDDVTVVVAQRGAALTASGGGA